MSYSSIAWLPPTGFAFSPERWAGVAVAGLAALFFTTRGRRRAARQAGKTARAGQRTDTTGSTTVPAGIESGAPDATKALAAGAGEEAGEGGEGGRAG